MSSADDDEFRKIARGIEEKVPEWIVVWGVYTRQFVLSHCGGSHVEWFSQRSTRTRLLNGCGTPNAGCRPQHKRSAKESDYV